MTTTPAQELATAATRLRRLAEAAASDDWGYRPWQTEECADKEEGSCACIVSQGVYQSFDEAQQPPVQYIADAELTVYADWIAAMHPGVGAALAQLLDRWAWLGRVDPDLLNRVGGPEALAVARLINGPAGGA